MSQKKQHQGFAEELDSFLKDDQKKALHSAEYRELFEIGQLLANQDYSKQGDKKAIYLALLNKADSEKEKRNMKTNKRIWKSFATAVASVALIGGISLPVIQPTFASEVMGKILHTISLGHITISQMEAPPENIAVSIPENRKDQIAVSSQDGPSHEVNTLIVQDSSQLDQYTMFNVLLPSYQPEGYTFDRAEFYKDEQGVVKDSKYITIYYKNQATGKEIFLQQRHADKETAYSGAFDAKIEATKVNDADAIMIGEHSVDWEANGVIYSLTAKELDREEVLKIAESIQ